MKQHSTLKGARKSVVADHILHKRQQQSQTRNARNLIRNYPTTFSKKYHISECYSIEKRREEY